jgi:hypothetical protein
MTGSAGKRLRSQLDAALAREADKLGMPLRFDEREAHHVEAAMRCADNRAHLQRMLNAELRGEKRPTIVTKLAAEVRLQDRAIAEHLGRISVGDLAPLGVSVQHRAAARARWGAPRSRRGA